MLQAQADTPSVLSASEMRSFWISWKDQTIRVGGGDVPFMYEKLNWYDPNFHSINSIGIMTCFGSSGKWIINSPRGKILCYTIINKNTQTKMSIFSYNSLCDVAHQEISS